MDWGTDGHLEMDTPNLSLGRHDVVHLLGTEGTLAARESDQLHLTSRNSASNQYQNVQQCFDTFQEVSGKLDL